jgi:hypothetical protein
MLQSFYSKTGAGKIRGLIILLIVLVGLVILVQYVRTRIKIEDMRSTVKEETTGAKIRETWNDIIIENILTKAVDLDIITGEDIQNDTWSEKLMIEIIRPLPDQIQVRVGFKIIMDFIVVQKVQDVLIEEKAKVYDM